MIPLRRGRSLPMLLLVFVCTVQSKYYICMETDMEIGYVASLESDGVSIMFLDSGWVGGVFVSPPLSVGGFKLVSCRGDYDDGLLETESRLICYFVFSFFLHKTGRELRP